MSAKEQRAELAGALKEANVLVQLLKDAGAGLFTWEGALRETVTRLLRALDHPGAEVGVTPCPHCKPEHGEAVCYRAKIDDDPAPVLLFTSVASQDLLVYRLGQYDFNPPLDIREGQTVSLYVSPSPAVD